MRCDITAFVPEVGKRRSKSAGIGLARAIPNRRGYVVWMTGPEPDLDIGWTALHDVPATAVVVEVGSIWGSIVWFDTTASISVVESIAICSSDCPRMILRI
jgi:hypothetical protein